MRTAEKISEATAPAAEETLLRQEFPIPDECGMAACAPEDPTPAPEYTVPAPEFPQTAGKAPAPPAKRKRNLLAYAFLAAAAVLLFTGVLNSGSVGRSSGGELNGTWSIIRSEYTDLLEPGDANVYVTDYVAEGTDGCYQCSIETFLDSGGNPCIILHDLSENAEDDGILLPSDGAGHYSAVIPASSNAMRKLTVYLQDGLLYLESVITGTDVSFKTVEIYRLD